MQVACTEQHWREDDGTGLGHGTMSEQMLQGENLALSVSAGQGYVEGLFLASSSSLFLRVACLVAKSLSKGGSTWVVSAAEISLADEWVC